MRERVHELIQMMIFQKNGKAGPSVAATLIERLPRQDDPLRPIEERLAKNVAASAYFGP